jgi:hypothetical protein
MPAPFSKACSIISSLMRPVHITLMNLAIAGYWNLLTPAWSAPP